ncbi:MAG: hypothetical protein AAFR46_03745 [Pseudomonadota bacterium]
MASFQTKDGETVSIDLSAVIRVRAAISSEKPAKTRVDWGIVSLLMNDLQFVVDEVRKEKPSVIGISVGRDKKTYFDAKGIKAVFPALPHMEEFGYRSSFKILGYRQHTKHSVEELKSMLAAHKT